MDDKLTTDLRRAANTWLAEEYKVCAEAVRYLLKEAADAIEDLEFACNRYEKDYKDLCAYLPKWIPVTERLPEFEGAVLCMRKSNVYGVRPHQEILYVDEYGFKNYDDIYLADGVVTHWMPLPEPPKEE